MHSIRISEDQWPLVTVTLTGSLSELSDDPMHLEELAKRVESIRGRGDYVVLIDALRFTWAGEGRVKVDTVPRDKTAKAAGETLDSRTVSADSGEPHPIQRLAGDSLGVAVVTSSSWVRVSVRVAAIVSRLSSWGPDFRFTAVETLQDAREWAGELLGNSGPSDTSGGIGAVPIVPK